MARLDGGLNGCYDFHSRWSVMSFSDVDTLFIAGKYCLWRIASVGGNV